MESIITRNGDYLYTKDDLIDFLEAAGIDRYDCDAVGAIFNSEENIQAAKEEIDSDLRGAAEAGNLLLVLPPKRL